MQIAGEALLQGNEEEERSCSDKIRVSSQIRSRELKMDHDRHVYGGETVNKSRIQRDEQIPIIKFTAEEIEIIRIKAKKYSVLGQLPGPSPQYRTFEQWCHSTLHTSMTACELLGNGFFQVLFSSEDGARHALSGIHFFQERYVPFTSWRPGFSAQNPASAALLDFPVWMQFLGLSLCHRNEECLRIFGSKFGQVLHYYDSDKYFDTTAGPRVKVLVKPTTVIPKSIKIPGSRSGVYHEHGIVTSENPFQCATCRTFGHNSRDCPQTSGRGAQGHRDARVAEKSASELTYHILQAPSIIMVPDARVAEKSAYEYTYHILAPSIMLPDARVAELQRSFPCQSSSNSPVIVTNSRSFPWVIEERWSYVWDVQSSPPALFAKLIHQQCKYVPHSADCYLLRW